MFASIEEKIIVGALAAMSLLVVIFGYTEHERSKGAAVCVQQQATAAGAEVAKDARADASVVADFKGDLSAIPTAGVKYVPMLMCDAPRSVHQVSASTGTKPATPAAIRSDSGLQTGTKPGIDIGSAVQDITFAGMLCTADAERLWELAIKESMK